MLIYAMSVPMFYERGIYKIGEAIDDKQLQKRKKTFQTYHLELVQVYGLWDIGDISRKADNHLHKIFRDHKYGHGGTEFFKDVSLDLLHEKIERVFGENSIRLV